METGNDVLAAAGRVYVRLRHLSGRIVDVAWAVQDDRYAREIVRLARVSQDAEALRLADRFERLRFGLPEPQATPAAHPAEPGDAGPASSPDKYIGALR